MRSVDQSSTEVDSFQEYLEENFDLISVSEGIEILDQQAWKYLGMSGEEFLRRYEAGELDHDDYDFNVMRVSMLIPFATLK